MNTTKVKVKFHFKNEHAAEILPLGFETELIPILSTKEKILVNEQTRLVNGIVTVINPAVVAPVGSFEGYTFKGANGETYGDYWIRLMVGYKSIGEIFTRINQPVKA